MRDRERENLLFAIASAIGLYTFRELERRQRLREAEEAIRRGYIDGELSRLRDGELGHRERSATTRRIVQVVVGAATLFATLAIAFTTLIAAHVL